MATTVSKSSNALDTAQQTCGTKVGPTHCSPFPSTDPFTSSFLGTQQSISAKLSSWEEELVNDTDKEFLLDGIHQGFRIIDKHSGSSIKPVHQQNHTSAYQHRAQVQKELLDQSKQDTTSQRTENQPRLAQWRLFLRRMVLLDLFMMAEAMNDLLMMAVGL